MALVMRLRREGTKKKPFYQIVIIDSRSKREGKFKDNIGTYNPLKNPSLIKVDQKKAVSWLEKGVKPSATVKKLLKISKI
ncbi:MAG: 30S ribosomal protein S16 [Candidatus Ratteibacteria bacterium]|nr:30S ribosomal protein S16 [Candidatus Ratteibacteria bacterium]